MIVVGFKMRSQPDKDVYYVHAINVVD